jgi:hypothetical protein
MTREPQVEDETGGPGRKCFQVRLRVYVCAKLPERHRGKRARSKLIRGCVVVVSLKADQSCDDAEKLVYAQVTEGEMNARIACSFRPLTSRMFCEITHPSPPYTAQALSRTRTILQAQSAIRHGQAFRRRERTYPLQMIFYFIRETDTGLERPPTRPT